MVCVHSLYIMIFTAMFVFRNSNVRTVQTITDLQNALKSEDDIQIVVPNELLETAEFKSFLANFNSFPIPPSDRQNSKTYSNTSPSSKQGEGSSARCSTPNNTPVTTRPPSVELPDDVAIFNPVHVETRLQNDNTNITTDPVLASSRDHVSGRKKKSSNNAGIGCFVLYEFLD